MVTNGNGSHSSWNDLNCDAHQDWICMIAKGTDPLLPPEPPSPVPGTPTHNAPGFTAVDTLPFFCQSGLSQSASSAPECGSNPGWRLNDDVCYYYNDTAAVDFHAALRHCRDEKALLASIHSKDEQAYVNSMVGVFVSSPGDACNGPTAHPGGDGQGDVSLDWNDNGRSRKRAIQVRVVFFWGGGRSGDGNELAVSGFQDGT